MVKIKKIVSVLVINSFPNLYYCDGFITVIIQT